MAVPTGIFMAPPATPAVRLIETDPFLATWTAEDDRQRRIAEQNLRMERAAQELEAGDLRMDAASFDLDERRRKAEEALALDLALRGALRPNSTMADDGMRATPASAPAAGVGPTAVPSRPSLADSTIQMESGGRLDARPIDPATGQPRSSAAGPGQFINSTWLSVLPEAARQIGLDISGMTPEQQLALRTDPMRGMRLSRKAVEVYAEMNRPILRQALGREPTDGELRLAHFLGGGGAANMLRADPDAMAEAIAGPDATRANPEVLGNGKRVRDVIARFGRTSTPAAPAATPAASPTDTMAGGGSDEVMPPYGRPAGSGGILASTERMRRAEEALAATPGGGAALLKIAEGEQSGMQRAKMKVFELAGTGKAEAAIALAQAIGLRINPSMLRDQEATAKIWDLLRTTATQDPAHAMQVLRNLRPGGNIRQAIADTRDPVPRTYGSRAAGRPVIRYVPGQGLFRIDPDTGSPELVVPVGETSSGYKMQARARELAVREAGSMVVHPGSAWVDRRASEIFQEFQTAAGQAAPGGSATPSAMDAAGIPPNAVPIPPSTAAPPAAAAPTGPSELVPGGAAMSGGAPDIFAKAQAAIRAGADADQVRRRSLEMFGVDILNQPAASGAPPSTPVLPEPNPVVGGPRTWSGRPIDEIPFMQAVP